MMYEQQLTILMNDPRFFILFLVIAIWSVIWKGIALWKAGRNSHKTWFIVLLVVNTVGILEILYIYLFSKRCKCCRGKKENLPANPM